MKLYLEFGIWNLELVRVGRLSRCYSSWAVFLFLVFLLSLPLPARTFADSGIYGRVAFRGELVPGIIVSAYSDGDSEYLTNPVAVSDPAATDGTYRLTLPPGQYTLVARSSASPDGRPDVGDYYCYYSGSPVIVSAGSWTPVGFNLVKSAVEERVSDSKTSIEGIVSYRDEPLEKLYLTLYDEALDGFRGPGMATIPVGKGGRFRVSVKPGKYFVIARKRSRGGMYGPMEIGDYFNYYPGNPVTVSDGEKVSIRLETVTRVSQLEEGEAPTPTIQGAVVDADGNPVAGLRVFAYRSGEVRGRPLYFSEPSNSTGQYSLLVPVSGDFTLVAKERFGGPAAEGEFTGRMDDLHLPPERGVEKIVIVVQKGGLP